MPEELTPKEKAEAEREPVNKYALLAQILGIPLSDIVKMGLDRAAQIAWGSNYSAAVMPRTQKGADWLRWQQENTGRTPTPRQLQSYEAQFVQGLQYPVGSSMWQMGWGTSQQYAGAGGQLYGPGISQRGWYALPSQYPATAEQFASLPSATQVDLKAQYLKDAASVLGIQGPVLTARALGVDVELPTLYESLITQLGEGVWGEQLKLWDAIQTGSTQNWFVQGYPDISMGREDYPYLYEPSWYRQRWGTRALREAQTPATTETATATSGGARGYGAEYLTYREGRERGGNYPQYNPPARWLNY